MKYFYSAVIALISVIGINSLANAQAIPAAKIAVVDNSRIQL